MAVGAAAVALLASPGLGRCVALATARRPDARLLAAASLAAALLIVWRAESVLHGAALALVASAGIVAAWVDAFERRLPDVVVLPVYPAVAALLLATSDADAMIRAASCALAGLALYGAGCAAGQVGFGDVKLAGLLGLVLGWASWQGALAGLVAVCIIGGGQALVVRALHGQDFPFGPALVLGAAAGLALAFLRRGNHSNSSKRNDDSH
nr:A24 family peptidase [Glycomyces sp. L485]